jgi:hypothetical protein
MSFVKPQVPVYRAVQGSSTDDAAAAVFVAGFTIVRGATLRAKGLCSVDGWRHNGDATG